MSVKTLRNQLLAAIAMVLVAALALGSSTFAWFAMNTTVSAKDMQVRAVAEKGLLINEVNTADDTNWDDEATAKQTPANASLLYPSSTADGLTWYHAASKKSNSAASASAGAVSSDLINGDSGYETLPALTAITSMSSAATPGDTAKRDTMGRNATADAGYYVHYTYYLKGASADAITLGQKLNDMNVFIKSVTATPGATGSTALDASLRVGIFMKASGNFYIFAPYGSYTQTYYVNASSDATKPIAGNVETKTDLTSLPNSRTEGTPIEVYLWFEGEDANCKSDNALAQTLDNIDVDIVFELRAVAAGDKPVTTP